MPPRRPLPAGSALARARAATRRAATAPRPVALSPLGVMRGYGRGGYHGASLERRALQEWTPALGSPDGDTIPDLPTLRARARDLERNAPLATGAIRTNLTSVVGPGLTVAPHIDRELLGLSEEEADAWERQAKRLFQLATHGASLDIAHRADFPQQTHQVLWGELVDGDIFAVRRWVEEPGMPFATRVQLVDADRICNPDFKPDTDRLAGGVEYDANGVALRYHVLQRHPGDLLFRPGAYSWDALPARGAASNDRLVLHYYAALRPGQSRGVSYLAPVIELFKQLERFTDAELMAAVLSAFFTVFVKQPFADEEGEVQGLATPPNEDGSEDTVTPKHQLKMGSGSIVALQEGEDITIADPKRPNGKFDPFILAILQQIGAALEIPVEILVKRFTASYSASRAAILEAWRAFLTRRARLVRGFCQPVYEWVLEEAVIRGYLRAPGFFADPLIRRAWCRAGWNGPSQGHIQPAQEAAGVEKRINIGLTTLEEEIAAYNGHDFEETHVQSAKERRMRRRDGLDSESTAERVVTVSEQRETTSGTGGANGSPDADDEDDRDDEEDEE